MTVLTLQDIQYCDQKAKTISRNDKLALYSKAGLIKTKYSDKFYVNIQDLIGSDDKLNEKGMFILAILRKNENAKRTTKIRRETAREIRRYSGKASRDHHGQPGSTKNLPDDDRRQEHEGDSWRT